MQGANRADKQDIFVWYNRSGWEAAYGTNNNSAAAACTTLQRQQQQQRNNQRQLLAAALPKRQLQEPPFFCSWHGITCSSNASFLRTTTTAAAAAPATAARCIALGSVWGVTDIEILNNNLSGNLSSPAFMQPLQLLHDCGLTRLVLGGGYGELRGTMTPGWGRLDRLTVLGIFTSNLTGHLPQELGGMAGGFVGS